MRNSCYILCIDFPVWIIQIQLVVFAQQVHVCFPQGIHGSYILPVTLEFPCIQTLVLRKHSRNDILSEVMVAVRIIHICDQHFSQLLPVKDIDTHGSQIALRMLRLFLEFHDTVCFIRVHNTEAACFLHRYR